MDQPIQSWKIATRGGRLQRRGIILSTNNLLKEQVTIILEGQWPMIIIPKGKYTPYISASKTVFCKWHKRYSQKPDLYRYFIYSNAPTISKEVFVSVSQELGLGTDEVTEWLNELLGEDVVDFASIRNGKVYVITKERFSKELIRRVGEEFVVVLKDQIIKESE